MRLHCTTISDASLVGGTLLIAILNAMKNMQIIYRRRVANGNAQKAALDIEALIADMSPLVRLLR
jgi:hypothetical protein